jgi:chorismate mutase
MAVRGIRGAIDIPENTEAAIEAGTKTLLLRMLEANRLTPEWIISIFLTATVDIDASYPAAAARKLGWVDVPLLDAQEIEVQGGMERVIRVLMHVETDLSRAQIRHVYLGGTARLRPDIAGQ